MDDKAVWGAVFLAYVLIGIPFCLMYDFDTSDPAKERRRTKRGLMWGVGLVALLIAYGSIGPGFVT